MTISASTAAPTIHGHLGRDPLGSASGGSADAGAVVVEVCSGTAVAAVGTVGAARVGGSELTTPLFETVSVHEEPSQ
jgi:hypothetical protein